MADNSSKICPVCRREIPYVADWPEDPWSSDGEIVVPLEAAVYQCPEHGLYKITISGAAWKASYVDGTFVVAT